MSKYLITGVAGFVGRYFCEYLKKKEPNAAIIGTDIVPNCDLDIPYYQTDMTDHQKVNDVIVNEKPDYIVHLASMGAVRQSWEDPSRTFQQDTTCTLNVLEAVRNNRLNTRILITGSSEEYGVCSRDKMPIKETEELKPQNPYAIAKVAQEFFGRMYATSLNVDVVMTRSFNHIGPRQNIRFVVPAFIKQLVAIKNGARAEMNVGNIEVARDMSDVRDVVAAYHTILKKANTGSVYNVCSGNAYQLKEIIQTVKNILNVQVKVIVDPMLIRPNDVMVVQGDNTKLKTKLGWQVQFDLTQTLKEIVQYFQGISR